MSKQQCKQSTTDPPMMKHKITGFFQRNTAETNDGVVKPVCLADPSSSEAELQDDELLSPTCDECSDERAVTIITSPLSSDVNRTTLSKILAKPMVSKHIACLLLGCCGFKTDGE